MAASGEGRQPQPAVQVGFEAALLEIEHQAEHWDTPDHGQTGHLIAQALRAAVDIARTGGLECEHRGGSADVPAAVLRLIKGTLPVTPSAEPTDTAQGPPSAA